MAQVTNKAFIKQRILQSKEIQAKAEHELAQVNRAIAAEENRVVAKKKSD